MSGYQHKENIMTTALLEQINAIETAERQAAIAAQEAQERRNAQQIVDCLAVITDWIGDSGLQWTSAPSVAANGELNCIQAAVDLPEELNATGIAVHVAPTPASRTNPSIYVATAPPPTYWLDNEPRWQQIRQPNVTLIDAIRVSRAARPTWDTWKRAVAEDIERKLLRRIEEMSQPHRWAVGYDEAENMPQQYAELAALDQATADQCWQLYQHNLAERAANDAARQALLDHCATIYPQYLAAQQAFAATLDDVQNRYDDTLTLTEVLIGLVADLDGEVYVQQVRVMTLGLDGDGYWITCPFGEPTLYHHLIAEYKPFVSNVTTSDVGTRAWPIPSPRFDATISDCYKLRASLLVNYAAIVVDIDRLTEIAATWPTAPQTWPGLTDDQVAQFVAEFVRRQDTQPS
jgi:hypothetical protein